MGAGQPNLSSYSRQNSPSWPVQINLDGHGHKLEGVFKYNTTALTNGDGAKSWHLLRQARDELSAVVEEAVAGKGSLRGATVKK